MTKKGGVENCLFLNVKNKKKRKAQSHLNRPYLHPLEDRTFTAWVALVATLRICGLRKFGVWA